LPAPENHPERLLLSDADSRNAAHEFARTCHSGGFKPAAGPAGDTWAGPGRSARQGDGVYAQRGKEGKEMERETGFEPATLSLEG
jgi:hypothetical protein